MKSYAEKENIEQEVLELIRYYIGKIFVSYGNLRSYSGIYKDDIESDVCFYIFKTNKKGETFLDKMSKIKDLKHLKAFVKRCVINQVNSKIREVESKPIFVRLDYKMAQEGLDQNFSSCDNSVDNFNVIADPEKDTEREALIYTAINSVSIDTYEAYLYEYEEGKYKVLDSADIIWMITRKKSATPMCESVISVRTKKPIKDATLQIIFLKEREKLIKALESHIDFWR